MVWEVQHLWDAAIPAAIGVTSAGATYFVAEKARRRRARRAEKLRLEEEARIAESRGKFNAEATARKLRAYRERDPEFRQAIAAFVSGEVANLDLAEGVPYRQEVSEPGSARSKIREMLGA